MRRTLWRLTALSLLAATLGCSHTHGICDCDVHPIGHSNYLSMAAHPDNPMPPPAGMPSPQATMASSPRLEPVATMPKAAN
jgi:hypothetical protein